MKVDFNTNNTYNPYKNTSFGSTNNAVAQGVTQINTPSKIFNKRNGIIASISAGILALGYYIFKPQEDKIVHESNYKA